jgi:tRNA pseudouridine55 synthase
MMHQKTYRERTGLRDCQLDGILLIDKNEGETSFNIVKNVRKVLNLKKVGHAGTLDPFATGLLIMLLGQGTKLFKYLMAEEKRYVASIKLGVETDTLDPTGGVVRTKDIPFLKPEEIEKRILTLVGEIEQVPPAYSAVNLKGKRAYKLARKGVSMELPKRTVTIHSLDVLSIDMPVITIDVVCSGGTYIRSLAVDIGRHLDSVAHLCSLRRLSTGRFHVKDALNQERIPVAEQGTVFRNNVIGLNDALPSLKESQVDLKTAEKIRNGYRPAWYEVADEDVLYDIQEGFIKIVNGPSLVAIMEIGGFPGDRNGSWLRNIRVFN